MLSSFKHLCSLVYIFLTCISGNAYSQKAWGTAPDAFILANISLGDSRVDVMKSATDNGFILVADFDKYSKSLEFVSEADLVDSKQRDKEGKYIKYLCRQCLEVHFTYQTERVHTVKRTVAVEDDTFSKEKLLDVTHKRFGSKATLTENEGNTIVYSWDIDGYLINSFRSCFPGESKYPKCGLGASVKFLGPFSNDLKRGWSIEVISHHLNRLDDEARAQERQKIQSRKFEDAKNRLIPNM